MRGRKKGFIVSEETREKMQSAQRKRQEKLSILRKENPDLIPVNKNAKPLIGDGVYYSSATAAAKALGLAIPSITQRIKSNNFPEWKYLENENE